MGVSRVGVREKIRPANRKGATQIRSAHAYREALLLRQAFCIGGAFGCA